MGRVVGCVCAAVVMTFVMGGAVFASTADGFRGQGNAAFKAGDYAKAAELYGKAFEADPTSTVSLYSRAVAHYRAGNTDGAIDDFKEVLNREPDNHKAMGYLGLIAMKNNRIDTALVTFAKAADIEQTSTYYYNAGLAAAKLGYSDLAKDYARKALVHDPGNMKARDLFRDSMKKQLEKEEIRKQQEAAFLATLISNAEKQAELDRKWREYLTSGEDVSRQGGARVKGTGGKLALSGNRGGRTIRRGG